MISQFRMGAIAGDGVSFPLGDVDIGDILISVSD